MPSDNPAVGETWEMVDPATGQPAQAVVTDINDTSVWLVSRQQRRLSFPLRSFHLIWKFIQEAPEQSCAYEGCPSQGYIQVNDLGRWVWVCRSHLPAAVRPYLPTDVLVDDDGEHCPSCSASVQFPGSSHRELEGFTLNRCGSCDIVWVRVVGTNQDAGSDLEVGLWGRETIRDVAALLESQGLRVRAIIGTDIERGLMTALGSSRIGSVEGVEVSMSQNPTANPASLILLGDRPRTNVQRLGGQPDRQSPGEAVPDVGSRWIHRGRNQVFEVGRVHITKHPEEPGSRVRVDGSFEGGSHQEVWLDEFTRNFYREVVETPPPCEAGEEWADSSGITVKVADVDTSEHLVAVELDSGGSAVIPFNVFHAKYTKVPPRRSAIDRVLDDD